MEGRKSRYTREAGRDTCSVDGCDRPRLCRGWCKGHYAVWLRTREEPTRAFLDTLIKRFMAKVQVDPSTGCWVWTAPSPGPYGQVSIKHRSHWAHRVAYELFVGPIPDGMHVDHLCRVPKCVNPGHLEAVTPKENNLRSRSPSAINGRKTKCVRGHDLTDPSNLRVDESTGERICRTCRRLRQRERRLQLRVAER
jgi:hypothetical protein